MGANTIAKKQEKNLLGVKETIVEHLDELRKRLVVVVVVHFVVAMVLYQLSDIMINYLLLLNPGVELIYITPSELFMVYIKMSFILAAVVCSPLTVYQIWAYASKGLSKKDKFMIFSCFVIGLLFFAVGVYFCYVVVLPTILDFFMRLTIDDIKPMISVAAYMSFINNLLLCFGAVFEIPIVAFTLAQFGVLKASFLKKYHGILILFIFIIAALITPPDVISQIMLGIPMTILLEISIAVCIIVEKRKAKKAKANEED